MTRTHRLAILATLFLMARAGIGMEPPEPCVPQYMAAALVANLYDIGMTTNELRLLNGTENPRLRRILERRLAVAAVEARHHIDMGPAAFAAIDLRSLASGVDRALQFVAEHPLNLVPLQEEHEREAKLPGLEWRNIAVPKENIEYVRAWVAKQPWSTAPPEKPSPN